MGLKDRLLQVAQENKLGHLMGKRSIWVLYGSLIVLSIWASTSALGSEYYKFAANGVGLNPIFKHWIFVAVGFAFAWLISRLNTKWLSSNWVYLFLAGIVLMVVLLPVLGVRVNHAVRWIKVGPIQLQPSEFLKLGLIFGGAIAVRSMHTRPEQGERYFWWYWGISLLLIMVVGSQNMSTGIILVAFLFLYNWIVRAPRRVYLKILLWMATIGFLGGVALMALPESVLKALPIRIETPMNRIKAMGKTEADPYKITDKNMQEQYAKIAIANGIPAFNGPGQSKIKDNLPLAFSDFVYAVIIEEYGWIGLLLIPALYLWWLWITWDMARQETNLYRRSLLFGIGLIFPLQALVNILVVSGVIMTGQPLPFISSGGSALIVSSIAMGVMLNISKTQETISRIKEEADEHGIVLEASTAEDE